MMHKVMTVRELLLPPWTLGPVVVLPSAVCCLLLRARVRQAMRRG